MESKPLTIQIPRPDSEGDCNINCELWNLSKNCRYSKQRVLKQGVVISKPAKGCPWFDGGKENE